MEQILSLASLCSVSSETLPLRRFCGHALCLREKSFMKEKGAQTHRGSALCPARARAFCALARSYLGLGTPHLGHKM